MSPGVIAMMGLVCYIWGLMLEADKYFQAEASVSQAGGNSRIAKPRLHSGVYCHLSARLIPWRFEQAHKKSILNFFVRPFNPKTRSRGGSELTEYYRAHRCG